MLRLLAPIAPVLLGLTFAQLGLGLLTTLIPLLLLRGGAPPAVIGLVASCYFAGFLAGSLTAAAVVARVGHVRAFAVFAAAAAIAAQLMAFLPQPLPIALVRVVMGYAVSGLFLVAESWLNDRADSATRGRTFGAYQVVNWGASAAGPAALNVVAPSAALFAAAGMAFSAAILPMALTQQANPVIAQGRRLGLVALYRVSPVGVVCCLASGLLNSAFSGLVPVYLRARGLDAADIARFVSVAMIAALAVQYPLGVLADRWGRRRLTVAALLAGLLAAVALALPLGLGLAGLTFCGCVLSGTMAPLYALGAGQTNDRLVRGEYMAAAGGLLFAWSLGASIGPTLAGALMGWTGPGGLFGYIAVALLAVTAFTLVRMRQRGEVPPSQQSAFVPTGTTPARLPALTQAAGQSAPASGEDAAAR